MWTIHWQPCESAANANAISINAQNSNVHRPNTKSPCSRRHAYRAVVVQNLHVPHKSQHAIHIIWDNNSIHPINGKTMRARIVNAPKPVKQIAKRRFVSHWRAKRSTPLRVNVVPYVILVIVNFVNQMLNVIDIVAMATNMIRYGIVQFVCAPKQPWTIPRWWTIRPPKKRCQYQWNQVKVNLFF